MTFEESLSALKGTSVVVSPGIDFLEPGVAPIQMLFANGTRLRAEYWRLVKEAKPSLTSFDHRVKYGLPEPIDAVKTLQETLQDKRVTNALLDNKTGDLVFEFAGNTVLQVFAFTGYEDWDILFPDRTGQYSNYLR